MLKEVKYYNRAYKLLTELSETYEHGFVPEKTIDFWEQQRQHFLNDPQLLYERVNSLKLTILTALLGLNKETIEKAEKFVDYDVFKLYEDYRTKYFKKESIDEFETFKNTNTIFDNWLSINVGPASDNDNEKIMRRVRNGLLHSNFRMERDNEGRSFTHIKTRSYYESLLLNQNFEQVVQSYFSNCGLMGLVEQDLFINLNPRKINSYVELYDYLKEMTFIYVDNKVAKYDGTNFLGKGFIGNKDAEERVMYGVKPIEDAIKQAIESGVNITGVKNEKLSNFAIELLIAQIDKFYPNFCDLHKIKQIQIIKNNFIYLTNSKESISNWLLHFDYIIESIYHNNLDINNKYISSELFNIESYKSALSILKAYLVMYRMQFLKDGLDSTKFDEIDYNKIDFDFKSDDYCLDLKNDNDSSFSYISLVSRQLQRDPSIDGHEANMRIISTIIRDGLAHGRIDVLYDFISDRDIIEITDINPKTGEEKVLTMSIDKFNKFLDSEAFLPKNCKKNTSTSTLVLTS